MELVIERDARRRLRRIQPQVADAIHARLDVIAECPYADHQQVKPLVGYKNLYRLRHGDWRIIFCLEADAKIMRVLKVETRDKAYQ